LSHPLYATSVVLCAFLVFAGLGSGAAAPLEHRLQAWRIAPAITPITLAVAGIALVALPYLVILPPLFDRLMPLSDFPKVLISLSLIAPLAFWMGMPFPLALSRVATWGDRGFESGSLQRSRSSMSGIPPAVFCHKATRARYTADRLGPHPLSRPAQLYGRDSVGDYHRLVSVTTISTCRLQHSDCHHHSQRHCDCARSGAPASDGFSYRTEPAAKGLSPAEAAHVSDPRAETAELGCAVKSRPTVEAATVEAATVEAATVELGEAMEATGAKSETGEPAEGIAVAIIRPVVVTRPTLGIVAAARPDTAVTRGERVSGWADRSRSGGARRRSAQHGRGRK
jgi:hypothetical protein